MTINWIGWILSGIVLLLLIAIGAILQNPVRMLITGKRAEGIVVGIATSPGQDSLQAPIFEFVTSAGERVRVSGRTYAVLPSARVGDAVMVAYDLSHPRDAQLLVLKEFSIVGVILGFIALIILLWMSGILISGDSTLDDPFHLLPAVISHFRLNPVRFPVLFLLSVVIPACGIGTYVFSKRALDLHSNGITAVGHVIDSQWKSSRLNNGSIGNGKFSTVAYKDTSGAEYNIRRSLAKPLSRLKTGDVVEVIYLPKHPDKGIVNTWDELYLIPLFWGLMLLAFLICFRLVLNGAI